MCFDTTVPYRTIHVYRRQLCWRDLFFNIFVHKQFFELRFLYLHLRLHLYRRQLCWRDLLFNVFVHERFFQLRFLCLHLQLSLYRVDCIRSSGYGGFQHDEDDTSDGNM